MEYYRGSKMRKRIEFEYLRSPETYATLLGVFLLTIEATVHQFFGFVSAFESLYILPIWIATRIGGRLPGAVLAVASAVVTTSLDGRAMNESSWVPSLILRLASYTIVMLLIAQVEKSLTQQNRLAMTDPLTGLLNRRALNEHGGPAFGRARRLSQPMSVAVIDCNNFKELNDVHGHVAGDQVLRILARTLERGTRASDLIARVGGDEFAVVLRETDVPEAQTIMGRIVRDFEAATTEAGYSSTVSVGLAPLAEESRSLESMLARADKAMYAHKSQKPQRAIMI